MSTAVLSSRAARPGPTVLAAAVVCALLFAALGALVVEPALHRLMTNTSAPRPAPAASRRPAPPPVNDLILSGDYVGADGLALRVEGATLAFGQARIVTAPHRLAAASEPVAQGVSYATALNTPSNVQIEVRRVASGAAPLCAEGAPGWLALAVRADGVDILPLRAGDPPGANRSPTALCPVRALGRR
ncbi:MAG: hypothetical protein K5831_04640 [Brevundimonas sp.]|uniref:hypothetical protein n=1 Tax=Brevundimonas sp. TaxID=1871086 RepID=UPI002588A820|nr:hypothetical protein [Brevundimonas sp.]MCV0414153.1 hypothetical protein [Brevundimonas sp.]